MKTETKPVVDGGTMDQWPPLAHITTDLPVSEKSRALCGAKIMGVDLGPLRTCKSICKKCVKIARASL